MSARLLLVDNYDSFTWNLAQAFLVLGAEVTVRRNDAITVDEALALDPTHVCISPGPGHPKDAGVSMAMIRAFVDRRPLLGVCLGHQALGAVFGATVDRAPRLMHGKSSPCLHDGTGLFAGLPQPMEVGRYHSLCVVASTLPPELVVSARTAEDEVMAIRHTSRPVVGVQFHPESVLTPDGDALLANFLAMEPA
ncbi:MAG: aminodeoxychorismate/anthranilate synthase component II [Alphaproteobacteria bacterium]|nr:aminodeoxychorismate/anthranilate synthase component II [Alphaproteobacteria bacterium]